jgi:DNA-binding MarR family transcriptional regulator
MSSQLPIATHDEAVFDPTLHPRIIALLRLAHETAQALLYQHLAAAGYGELRPAHFRLLRFPGIDGVRPTVLAQRLETSKQALTPLLNDLEQWGYLERHLDPRDGRGRVLSLTPRGHDLMTSIRQRHAEIEQEWAQQLGSARFADLRATLSTIAESHPAAAARQATAAGSRSPAPESPPNRVG